MILSRTQIELLKLKMLKLSDQYDNFYMLDSCNLNSPLNEGKYELLVAVGAKRSYIIDSPLKSLDKLQEFLSKSAWYFGVISYEVKDDIENLESKNREHIKCPSIAFIEPEGILTIGKDGLLNVAGNSALFGDYELNHKIENEELELTGDQIVNSGMTQCEYLSKVAAIHEHILRGNVYELNLCYSRLLEDVSINNPSLLFRDLVKLSPVPFAAYVKRDSQYLISASPERFLKLSDKSIVSQPIKGTSSRSDEEQEDEKLKSDLFNSEKERAENVMIVDLVRNDLAKCSLTGSVKVRELFGIHSYAQVHQMVSTIESELNPDTNFTDILQSTFPMGSMTGTPKIAAMKLIEELENDKRGVYSGSVGFIDPEGNFDFNVVIRSIVYDANQRKLSYGVGGAITIDSDPQKEWEETELKASAIEKVLGL